MCDNSANQSASLSFKIDIPPSIIREYFEGLAKVEREKSERLERRQCVAERLERRQCVAERAEGAETAKKGKSSPEDVIKFFSDLLKLVNTTKEKDVPKEKDVQKEHQEKSKTSDNHEEETCSSKTEVDIAHVEVCKPDDVHCKNKVKDAKEKNEAVSNNNQHQMEAKKPSYDDELPEKKIEKKIENSMKKVFGMMGPFLKSLNGNGKTMGTEMNRNQLGEMENMEDLLDNVLNSMLGDNSVKTKHEQSQSSPDVSSSEPVSETTHTPELKEPTQNQ